MVYTLLRDVAIEVYCFVGLKGARLFCHCRLCFIFTRCFVFRRDDKDEEEAR